MHQWELVADSVRLNSSVHLPGSIGAFLFYFAGSGVRSLRYVAYYSLDDCNLALTPGCTVSRL